MSSLKKIWHRLIASLGYLFVKTGLLFVRLFQIAGYKHSNVGTFTILAPPKQMQIVLDGVALLRDIDLEIFKKLTVERKYLLFYHKKRRTSIYEIYTITDNYLFFGKEGVVICLVQTILDRAMKDSLGRFSAKHSEVIEVLRENRKQLFEFAKKHSFSPELVKWCQKSAEKELGLKNKQDGNQ